VSTSVYSAEQVERRLRQALIRARQLTEDLEEALSGVLEDVPLRHEEDECVRKAGERCYAHEALALVDELRATVEKP